MGLINNSEILFILNPNSGGKEPFKIIDQIKQIDDKLTCIITKNKKEVKEVFEKNMEKFTVFVVVGGDGSVNESVQYLLNRPDKYLAVFPNGSGNGFANELGFKRNLKSLINDINRGNQMDLDIIKLNNLFCINTCGVGFDSNIAHAFSQTKNRGLFNYILLTAKSIFSFNPFFAKIISTDFKEEGKYIMITIANTRQFGNNAVIAPMAKPNDGIIELVLVKPFPFYTYLLFFIQLFRGNLKKSKYIDFVRITGDTLIDTDFKYFHIDGEPVTFDDKITISVLRNQFKIIKTSSNKL